MIIINVHVHSWTAITSYGKCLYVDENILHARIYVQHFNVSYVIQCSANLERIIHKLLKCTFVFLYLGLCIHNYLCGEVLTYLQCHSSHIAVFMWMITTKYHKLREIGNYCFMPSYSLWYMPCILPRNPYSLRYMPCILPRNPYSLWYMPCTLPRNPTSPNPWYRRDVNDE